MYYAFDLATSGNFEQICYGCVQLTAFKKHYFSKSKSGLATEKLHPVRLVQMVFDLNELAQDNRDLVVGWGSLGYDCRLLYSESIAQEQVIELAYNHCDMFWQLAITTGFWVSLPEVAMIHNIELPHDFGAQVPKLWNSGDIDHQRLAMTYHIRAVQTIHEASINIKKYGLIQWVDKKTGKPCKAKLELVPNRVYLDACFKLPEKAFTKTTNEPIKWLREAIEIEKDIKMFDSYDPTLDI